MKLKKEAVKKETKKEVKKEIKEVKEEIKKVDVPNFYILRNGETLSDVSKKFGISEEELIKLNGDTVIGGNQIKLK